MTRVVADTKEYYLRQVTRRTHFTPVTVSFDGGIGWTVRGSEFARQGVSLATASVAASVTTSLTRYAVGRVLSAASAGALVTAPVTASVMTSAATRVDVRMSWCVVGDGVGGGVGDDVGNDVGRALVTLSVGALVTVSVTLAVVTSAAELGGRTLACLCRIGFVVISATALARMACEWCHFCLFLCFPNVVFLCLYCRYVYCRLLFSVLSVWYCLC